MVEHRHIEQKKSKPSENLHGVSILQIPLLLVTLVALTIFVAEFVVMLLFTLLPPIGAWMQAFIDSILLILFLAPSLYFLTYRPMRNQINALVHFQNQLQSEITERKRAEDALRQSEKFLKFFSSQLLSNQEKERRWISTELHEELAQDLAALNFRLQLIEQLVGKDTASLKKECEQNIEAIRKIISSLRKICGELSPIEIEHGGLSAALRELVCNTARNAGIDVSNQIIELDHLISSEAKTVIYRIVQEAIANAEKHAHATHLSVITEQRNDYIYIEVKDDGTGFNTENYISKAPADRGLGLVTMQERADLLGGSLEIRSQLDHGTKVAFTIRISGE